MANKKPFHGIDYVWRFSRLCSHHTHGGIGIGAAHEPHRASTDEISVSANDRYGSVGAR